MWDYMQESERQKATEKEKREVFRLTMMTMMNDDDDEEEKEEYENGKNDNNDDDGGEDKGHREGEEGGVQFGQACLGWLSL